MRLPTKTLIAKIEALSAQMNPDQLKEFLDVLDSLAIMVEDANALPPSSDKSTVSALNIVLH